MQLHLEDTDEDYAIFGKIVLLWSHVEAHLITIIFNLMFEPNKLEHKGIPWNFKERIKLAIKGYETLPRYAAIKDEAIEAIMALEPLHEHRTVIVHGFYDGKKMPGNYVFGLVKWGKGTSGAVDAHVYSSSELNALIQAIAEARRRLEFRSYQNSAYASVSIP